MDPLARLLDQMRLLDRSIHDATVDLHRDDELPVAERAILQLLLRRGPTSVPDLARARNQTRQQIQSLVDVLVERGWAEPAPDPGRRRSHLFGLTSAGRTEADLREDRERLFLQQCFKAVNISDVVAAAATLESLGAALAVERVTGIEPA